MGWLNIFGLCIVSVILIPNIVFAMKCKDGFENKWHNKYVEIAEQIGRFGCFAFMIFNVPGTCFGWPSNEAFAAYLIADGLLAALYSSSSCAVSTWRAWRWPASYRSISRWR